MQYARKERKLSGEVQKSQYAFIMDNNTSSTVGQTARGGFHASNRDCALQGPKVRACLIYGRCIYPVIYNVQDSEESSGVRYSA